MLARSTNVTGSIQVDASDPQNIKMAANMSYDLLGQTVKMGEWMKDGYVYVSMDDGTEKTAYKYAVPDQLAALESLEAVDISAMNVSGLAMIDSISEKDGVYTMVIGKAMAGYMNDILSMLADEEITADMNVSDITMTVTTDRSGKMKAMTMTFGMSMQMELEGEVFDVAYDYDVAVNIKATGSKVKVTFPRDLSSFAEISLEEAMAAQA